MDNNFNHNIKFIFFRDYNCEYSHANMATDVKFKDNKK